MPTSALFTIGQLADTCGVPTSAIRFWERNGLIEPTARESGQRRYLPETALLVGTLKLCQEAGFTLAEIREMFARHHTEPDSWRAFIARKLADIERRQAELDRAHTMLSHALLCEHNSIEECPKFQYAVAARLNHPITVSAPLPPGLPLTGRLSP